MIARTTIQVPEWFFDKLQNQMGKYNMYIVGEYKNGMLDHTILRIEEVLAETDKAFKVNIDAECNGHFKLWSTWIPKSLVE